MSSQKIEASFPNLEKSGYSITSPATIEYNCIAWAAGETEAWWEPDPMELSYWPLGIPREYSLKAYIKAYEIRGYVVCADEKFEKEFEKIAIYVDGNKKPQHAARQLSTGHWTSKLGSLEDIEHSTLDGLCDSTYGAPAVFMKRPKK